MSQTKEAVRPADDSFLLLQNPVLSGPDMKRINKLWSELSGTPLAIDEKRLFAVYRTGCLSAVWRKYHPETGGFSELVGIARLSISPTLQDSHGRIDDVIVDKRYRGWGLGRRLVTSLIDTATKAGVTELELTTHSKRAAARTLFVSLGFAKRATNVYRMRLAP